MLKQAVKWQPHILSLLVKSKIENFYSAKILAVFFAQNCATVRIPKERDGDISDRIQCGDVARQVYLPRMCRVCSPCLYADPTYRTIVRTSAQILFRLSDRHLRALPVACCDSTSTMIKVVYVTSYLQAYELGMKVHGSELDKKVKELDTRKEIQYRQRMVEWEASQEGAPKKGKRKRGNDNDVESSHPLVSDCSPANAVNEVGTQRSVAASLQQPDASIPVVKSKGRKALKKPRAPKYSTDAGYIDENRYRFACTIPVE
jgi:hypothetical protein